MRKVLAVVLAVVLVGMVAYSADAQVPNIQVYFDQAHTQTTTECRPGGQFQDSLHVVANNFNNFVQAVEFSVDYSPALTWTNDEHNAPLFAGNSRDGIALSYQISQNAFAQWRILTATYVYLCVDCGDQQFFGLGPLPVVVGGYLGAPSPRYTTPGGVEIDVIGMTSLICRGSIGIEETTWGGVKSLYTE